MRRKYLLLLAAAPLAALGGPAVTGGCGCGGDSETPDAGRDARAEAATRPDAGPDATDAAADGPAVPCSVPGYLLDDAYDQSCGFCYAGSTAVLPPPIAWEACDSSAIPAGMVCKQMVEDWPMGQGPFKGEYISQVAPTWVQQDGTVTMAITRAEGDLIYRMVADADGPVHQAIIETKDQQCTLGSYDLRDGRVAYRIYDSEQAPLSSYGGGCYGADVGQLRPRVLTHYHDTNNDRDYYVSSLGLFEVGSLGLYIDQYDWTTSVLVRRLDSPTMNNGFGIAHVWPRADAVSWDAYSGFAYMKLRSWTADAGASDLITFGSDWTKGAGDLGTGGPWMAWAIGDGRPNPNTKFDRVHLMRGPFTTDASNVTGTEMTTVSGLSFSDTPFVVGCGYAARQSSVALDAGPTDPATLLLFRLSDGYRWSLPNALPMEWTRPLAISCTELFSLLAVPSGDAGSKAHYTIARVRLDSLGPGTPPD